MRQKTARQKGEGGGWHYVSLSRDGGHPIGYCAQHEPHATEAEARECYGQYVRDSIRLDAARVGWIGCYARPDGVRCKNPTQSAAEYGDDGYGSVPLCPEHMTIEQVIESGHLAGAAGEAWVS